MNRAVTTYNLTISGKPSQVPAVLFPSYGSNYRQVLPASGRQAGYETKDDNEDKAKSYI